MGEETKQRIVQELVPGRQITLAHVIANPDELLLTHMGLTGESAAGKSAIGVLTVTPAETAIILGDIAIKASGAHLGHLDCYENGSLVITGTVSEVQASVQAMLRYAADTLQYEVCGITAT
ncbi:MAG: BMC domain-containing protein [Oscillospiraceae bacterium]